MQTIKVSGVETTVEREVTIEACVPRWLPVKGLRVARAREFLDDFGFVVNGAVVWGATCYLAAAGWRLCCTGSARFPRWPGGKAPRVKRAIAYAPEVACAWSVTDVGTKIGDTWKARVRARRTSLLAYGAACGTANEWREVAPEI